MAVPKKRKPKSKARLVRAAWMRKQKVAHLVRCPNCGAYKLPHFACPECGYYRDKQVLVVKSGEE